METTIFFLLAALVGVAAQGEYLGCYQDDANDRDIWGTSTTFADNYPQKCIDYCYARNFLYAALQYGSHCLCGDSYGRHGAKAEEWCAIPCPGLPSENCGSYLVSNVYSTGIAGCGIGKVECHALAVCITNDDGSSQCRCNDGYYGNGITECSLKCKCTATGDPHYITYDGHRYDFQGHCSYLLSEAGTPECGMSVKAKHQRWRRYQARTTKTLTVTVWSTTSYDTIVIDQGKVVTINGIQQNGAISTQNYDLIIKGTYVIVENNCGMEAMFDGRYNSYVYIPKEYGPSASGLCGTCNGDREDDFTLKDGTYVGNDYSLIGKSYWIPGINEPEIECNIKDEDLVCSDEMKAQIASDEYCGKIRNEAGPFQLCIPVMGAERIQNAYENCEYDVCVTWDDPIAVREIVCSSMALLQSDCNALPVGVVHYRTASFCPADCKPNMVYDPSVIAVQPTCKTPNPPDVAVSGPAVEGCVCQEGFLYDDGRDECVDFQNCGCETPDNYYPLGAGYLTEDCNTEKVCVHEGGSTFLKDQLGGCGDNEQCTTVLPGPDGIGVCDCIANHERKDGVCTAIDWCDPEPCKNGGICVGEPATYSCSCPPNFFGDICEQEEDICDPNPCNNGGVCVKETVAYSCTCPVEYTGDHCEIAVTCIGESVKLRCLSGSKAYRECTVTGASQLLSVEVNNLLKETTCVYHPNPAPEGYTEGDPGIYGYTDTYMWVHRGCKARFLICYLT